MSDEVTARRELRDPNFAAEPADVSGDVRGDVPEVRPAPAPAREREEERIVPLFSNDEGQRLKSRWESLQVGFVDEPKKSVEQADRLVTDAINNLAEGFKTQRHNLEQQWHREGDVSTEDLRLAFRRYRSFFERLLSL
jgi:hypothetical protein